MAPFENWQGFKEIEPPLPDWEPNPDPSSIEIPGLETSASLNDQIDQMDQLITIKLQNIDRNFQIVHDVMANHILPAFQKYAVSTEPVREAAQFWLSFYEAAAQTSLPPAQDSVPSQEEVTQETIPTSTFDTSDEIEAKSYDQTVDDTGDSTSQFTADETQMGETSTHYGPVSSTPLHPPIHSRVSHHDETQDFAISDESSRLDASLETPMQRLGRQMQSLDISIRSGDGSRANYVEPTPTTIFHRGTTPHKGKGKTPVHRNALLKKAVTPKRKNPFIPPGSSKKQWNGIVDLSKSPGVPRFTPQRRQTRNEEEDTTADTADEIWPPGMSPLQFLKIDLPGVPNMQPSPRKPKDASRHIRNDVLASINASRNTTYLGNNTASFAGTTSTDLSVPVLPSLGGGRWQGDQHSTSSMSTPLFESAKPLRSRVTDASIRLSHDHDSFSSDESGEGGNGPFQLQNVKETTGSSDSDSDSAGSDDGTLHPGFVNIPQVGEGDDSFDDSFDAGARAGTGTGTNLFAPRGSNVNDFALKGNQLLDHTLGIGDVLKERAISGPGVDSPTPFGGPSSP